MSRTFSAVIGTALVSVLLLSGCAAANPAPEDTSDTAAQAPSTKTSEAPQALTQEESCEWAAGRLPSGSASDAPPSPGSDLATALIGSWQHTHINEGSGFEEVEATTDIRYVFPSSTRLLYCQDVKEATTQAENAVAFELDGVQIVLPAPATGYAVDAWSADAMVWTNNRDGSLYLLKRR